MKKLLWFVTLLLFVLVAGCSDDNGVNDKTSDDDARPAIPEPTSYAGTVPAISEELVVKTVPLSDYSPYIIGAKTPNPPFGYVADSLYTVYTGATPQGIYQHRIDFITEDAFADSCTVGFHVVEPLQPPVIIILSAGANKTGVENPWTWISCPSLSQQPYLQLVRYWVRIGDYERYSGNTSKTTTRSTTRGTTETSASEFSRTLGIETSVSGSWFVDFEVKIKAEFSWSESHETSISQEETFEESFTISAPEGRNIVYCVWQLIEEYRIVGPDGELFDDPNYLFIEENNYSVCPTRELVPMTTYFDS